MPECPYIATRLNLSFSLIRIVYNGRCLSSDTAQLAFVTPHPALRLDPALSCLAAMAAPGKDVPVVFSDTPTCQERMSQILPLVGSRSELLNWSARQMWKHRSLPPRLFDFYRFLRPLPFRLERALQAVLVFNGFGWPRRFDFSEARARGSVMEHLEKALA